MLKYIYILLFFSLFAACSLESQTAENKPLAKEEVSFPPMGNVVLEAKGQRLHCKNFVLSCYPRYGLLDFRRRNNEGMIDIMRTTLYLYSSYKLVDEPNKGKLMRETVDSIRLKTVLANGNSDLAGLGADGGIDCKLNIKCEYKRLGDKNSLDLFFKFVPTYTTSEIVLADSHRMSDGSSRVVTCPFGMYWHNTGYLERSGIVVKHGDFFLSPLTLSKTFEGETKFKVMGDEYKITPYQSHVFVGE